MVPSTITQAYLRSSLVTNADGSASIMIVPGVNGGILTNTSGLAVATWTPAQFANGSAISGSFGEGRICSVGIKATPSIALTSIPGMVYSGAFTPATYANLLTLTAVDFQQLVTSHQSISTNGATSTGRPVDPDSFTFLAPVVASSGWGSAPNTTTTLPFSVPYVSFVGLPASSTIFFEVCMNIEGTPIIAHLTNTVIPATESSGETKLSDSWNNPETMINRMKPLLPHPGRASDAAAASDSSFLQTLMSGLGGVAGSFLGPLGTAVGTAAGGALGSVAQSLFKPSVRSRAGASQNYSKSFQGYKL